MQFEALFQHIVDGKAASVAEDVKAALADNVPAATLLDSALVPAMGEVGRLFEAGEIYVPEMLVAARAMQGALNLLRPLLVETGKKPVGTVAIGTVAGDLHDIGKNLCIMMLRGAGFVVHDLGVDTSPDKFIEAVEETKAPLLGMSALLTTTMPNMGKTIEAFIDADLRDEVKIMVGGAPVTQDFADDMGADGYGKDALACVALAKNLLGVVARS